MTEENDLYGSSSKSLWPEADGEDDSSFNDEESVETAPSKPLKKSTKNDKGKAPKRKRIEKPRIRQKKVMCTVENCNYSTPYPKDLTRHMRKHTGEKPFSCDICRKSFSRYDKLIGHKRTHEGLKPNKCSLCDYASLDAASLRKHLRIHSDERPYRCQMCPYRARDSSQLVVHFRHHTGDSPYTCSYKSCQAAFKTQSDLQRHSRHHTGEKPYACSFCEYRASVKCNLNSHIKKHHNQGGNCNIEPDQGSQQNPELLPEEPTSVVSNPNVSLEVESKRVNPLRKELRDPLAFLYACKLCEYKGDTFKYFQSHMRRKHKIKEKLIQDSEIMKPPKKRKRNLNEYPKLFECSTCPAAFVREDSLRCHVKQHVSLGPPPMPVLPVVDTIRHTENIATYDGSIVPQYVEYLDHVESEEIVESINVNHRPQVITYADRVYLEN